jgi:serine acetyltransferase
MMGMIAEFPADLRSLRDEAVASTAGQLAGEYSKRERSQIKVREIDPACFSLSYGAGQAAWPAVSWGLETLQELVAPGCFVESCKPAESQDALAPAVQLAADSLYGILRSYFDVEFEGPKSREAAASAALAVISRLPEFQSRARWNIFAALKDPAVWDSFVLREEARREELGRLDLLAEIDKAILARDRGRYLSFLKGHGFDYAYDYQIRLVRRGYPGWRALLLHDIAHSLALGGAAADGKVEAPPVPFLPRVITEYSARLYQTDIHPECVIGDANFVEHPHRGITMGQTGRVGIGCILYPCTLGGVTDKVKDRHPIIGDFVLIGTDVGIFGIVHVGDHSVIGANTEIYGLVKFGKGVRVGSAVVARTVRTEAGKPGKLVFEDGAKIGDETLIINDQPSDLIIPENSTIPAHSHVVNDGFGRPKLV